MSLPLYLAMTSAEFAAAPSLPEKVAWMACHFSCYGTGLSNLPDALPEGSVLIVNDRTPICGHDGQKIAGQLTELVERFSCSGVLLDFQRPGVEEAAGLCAQLISTLSCPIGVTEDYAEGLDCSVFLSPLPPGKKLAQHTEKWSGRELWLEVVTDARTAVVTQTGCQWSQDPLAPLETPWFLESKLHCRYHWRADDHQAVITLHRTVEDIPSLLEEAEMLGISRGIGLYQQLKQQDRSG